MSGCSNDLSTLITNEVPSAIFIHCYAHQINLVLEEACSRVTEVRNCIGTSKALYNFIESSSKRHALFHNLQDDEFKIVLKNLCTTRWASWYRSFKALKDSLPLIFKFLELEDNEDKSDSGANAASLFNATKNFLFVFLVEVLHDLFENISILSKYLQSQELHLEAAAILCDKTRKILRKWDQKKYSINIGSK